MVHPHLLENRIEDLEETVVHLQKQIKKLKEKLDGLRESE